MLLRYRLAVFVMAAGAAAPVLAGSPALASGRAVTGPEIAYGVLTGRPATTSVPALPLAWRGLVNAHGVFAPRGSAPRKGQRYTFTTSAGKLTVWSPPPRPAGRTPT